MNIHVVKQGETANTIAESYGVSVSRLIRENELEFPEKLVPGQTIVITDPELTYIVKEGDTLESISNSLEVSILQLLRNNPFLAERTYMFPGETLVISYNYEERELATIGYALPFINETILRKTLPYLTYLFVYNYRLDEEGNVIPFYDDTNIIELSKAYGVAPLMLVTSLSAQGTPNTQAAYEILLNVTIQNKIIDNILGILESKGYWGFNMTFLYLTEATEELYSEFTKRVTYRMKQEGYLVYVTVDPRISTSEEEIDFPKINYTIIGNEVNGISFISYVWGTTMVPPSPISSLANLSEFLEYVSSMIPPEKINAGIQIIAYDWEIPYVAGFSKTLSLSLNSAIDLARDVGAVIEFDERSQTPFFNYTINEAGYPKQHVVWFIDARTIDTLTDLIRLRNYRGPSVWNIMNYYPQLWLVINSQYSITKVLK